MEKCKIISCLEYLPISVYLEDIFKINLKLNYNLNYTLIQDKIRHYIKTKQLSYLQNIETGEYVIINKYTKIKKQCN